MEEQVQKECKTKKCCGKCIIVVILCSLLCFFIGYYAGTKSLAKVSRATVNRPFKPSKIPKIPMPSQVKSIKSLPRTKTLPNIQRPPLPKNQRVQTPNVQRPPIQNTPKVQSPKGNITDDAKEKLQAKANSSTEQKK